MTEKECFDRLIEVIYPAGFICPNCGRTQSWSKPQRRIIICKSCRREISPLAGSMFSRSHISLETWFKMIYMLTSSPERVITAKNIFEELDMGSYRTAWEALNKIRFSISHNEPRIKLRGIIEFDEMVVSGIGSEYNKVSILGALEIEGEKRLTLQMIKNPDEMNIKDYLKHKFSNKVTVITNPEKLYIRNWLVLNRIRQKSAVKHYGANFMSIHIILQDVRYGLKNGHHSISEKYLQRNLDEYVFTFNHNSSRDRAYEKVIDYMVNTKITSYREAEKIKRSFLSIIAGE
ncbi:MAG TPA: IS1595 family transposase [Spirochaeta sp.]|nr:IS1595 family transposase [Spirochaeta sp.]